MTSGKVPSHPDPTGGGRRVVRVIDLENLRSTGTNCNGRPGGHVADSGGQKGGHVADIAADTPDSPPLNPPRHDVSPGASGWYNLYHHRAELAETERDLLREDRQRHAEEIAHLRAQLDQRAREMEARSQAEAELRLMLGRLEATNAELARALVVKALPPHVETENQAKPRRRWWWFFRERL